MSVIEEVLNRLAEKQILSGNKDFAYRLAEATDLNRDGCKYCGKHIELNNNVCKECSHIQKCELAECENKKEIGKMIKHDGQLFCSKSCVTSFDKLQNMNKSAFNEVIAKYINYNVMPDDNKSEEKGKTQWLDQRKKWDKKQDNENKIDRETTKNDELKPTEKEKTRKDVTIKESMNNNLVDKMMPKTEVDEDGEEHLYRSEKGDVDKNFKSSMTFREMVDKYATGRDPIFKEPIQKNWDELVGRWNKELNPNYGVSRRVSSSSNLGKMIKKYAQLEDSHKDENGFLFPYDPYLRRRVPKHILDHFDEWLVDHPHYHPDDDRSDAWDQFMEEQMDGEWSNKLKQEKPEYLAHKSEIDFGDEQSDMARPWGGKFSKTLNHMIKKYAQLEDSHKDENGFLFPYEDWDDERSAPEHILDHFDEWLVDHPHYHPNDDRSDAWDQFMVEQMSSRDGEWSNKLKQEKPEYLAHKSEIDFGDEQSDMARPWGGKFSKTLNHMIKKYAQSYIGDPGFEHELEDSKMESGFLGDGEFTDMSNPYDPGTKEAMIWSEGFQAGRTS